MYLHTHSCTYIHVHKLQGNPKITFISGHSLCYVIQTVSFKNYFPIISRNSTPQIHTVGSHWHPPISICSTSHLVSPPSRCSGVASNRASWLVGVGGEINHSWLSGATPLPLWGPAPACPWPIPAPRVPRVGGWAPPTPPQSGHFAVSSLVSNLIFVNFQECLL